LFLNLRHDGQLAATLTIDGDDPHGAHLRWFVVGDTVRGVGLGRFLMQNAVAFCHKINARKIWLTTFKGLDAAAHLYESYGFKLVRVEPHDQWKSGVTECRYELPLS
jgi:GNAT superfamily N-acetyltransferase